MNGGPHHRAETSGDRFGHTFENDAEVVSLVARLVVVTDKPDLATPIAANIDLPASRPHRMFDQASGARIGA